MRKIYLNAKNWLVAVMLLCFAQVAFAQNTLDNLGYTNSDPKSVVAYSLRQLSTSYTGPLVRVTIGANTYDVWPDGSGNFSLNSVISSANPGTIPGSKNGSTTLSSVIGSNNATIAIWYSQSGVNGNNYNVSQSTVSQQPRVITSGSIEMQNGRAAAYFTRANSVYLISPSQTIANFGSGQSFLGVFSRASNFGGGTGGLFRLVEGASNNFFNVASENGSNIRYEAMNNGSASSIKTNIGNNTLYQLSGTKITSGTVNEMRINGNLIGTEAKPSLSGGFTAQFALGEYNGFWDGYISEVIVFNSNLTATQRATAENNEITFYSTTPTQTYSPPGNALHFDGVDDYITTTTSYNNPTTFTLSAWFRTTTAQGGIIGFSPQQTGGAVNYDRVISMNGTGQVNFYTWNGGVQYIFSPLTYNDGKYHHVAATFSSANGMRLYIDGALVASNSSYNTAYNATGFWRIGNIGSGNGTIFNGQIDQVKIYNTELNLANIQTDMYSTNASAAGLIDYYNFDQGVASSNSNVGITSLTDATSNNNTGTLQNFNLFGSTGNWVESYAMVVPTATAATSVSSTGFTANWTAPANGTVDNYLLDVSTTADFTGLISGSPFTIASGNTSRAITGLMGGTYYYRVRADKTSVTGQGGSSNTISQAIVYTTPGNALNLDGSNDYVSTANQLSYPNNTTLSAWFRTTATSGSILSFIHTQTGGFSLADQQVFIDNSGKVSFFIWNGSNQTISSSLSYNDGRYHHVAATYTANDMRLYVDGALVASRTGITSNQSYSGYWRIGNGGVAGLFNGSIDQVKVYNTVLNLAAIQTDMYSTNTSASGLTTYYNFDNGVASAINTSITTVTDLTGTNTGTLQNFSLTNATSSNWVESFAMIVPTATAATNVTATSFTANWTAPSIGSFDNYLVDVSANASFIGAISGSPFTVAGNTTSSAITGLTGGTYYYRVRADKTSVTGQGSPSNTISQLVPYTPPGNALHFDGNNDLVTTSSTTSGNFGTGAFTVETWIRNSSGGGYIVNKRDVCANTSFWSMQLNTNKVTIEVMQAGGANYYTLSGATSVNDGKWHHIAFTRSASGVISIYVDGVLDASATPSAIANISNTSAILLGNSVCNSPYAGSVDELRIWNVERTQSQLQANMLNTISASTSGLIDYYNFDNGVASANNTATTTLTDLTSTANDGTLSNFTLNNSTSNWIESYAMVEPTATAATNVTTTGFTANWTAPAVGTVDNYILDISTNSAFTAPITGSPFTLASNVTSYNVTSGAGTYYYRLRAEKASVTGQGSYSNTISQTITLPAPGNALNFDGVNDYVSTTTSYNNPTVFTISAWFRTTQAQGGIIGFSQQQTGNVVLFDRTISLNSTGQLNFYTWNGSSGQSINSALSYNDGKYHHVAATFSGTNGMRLYVDGALVASNASFTTAQNATGYWRLSNLPASNSNYFSGNIDQAKVYNTELNLAAIQTDMYSTNASASGLIAYFNFDNGVANANNAGATTLTDLTSTGNTGSLQNFTLNGNTSNWVESYAMVIPVATAATNVLAKSFTANWSAPSIGTADNYFLDVSTSATFASFVSGYNGLSVSGTSQAVTGLSANTTYYYRVRANKTSVADQGGNSSTITTTTDFSQPGNGLHFDGVNDYVSTANLISNPQNFTISTWFKTTSTTVGYLVGFAELQTGNTNAGSADRVISIDASGKLGFYIFSGSGNTITSPLSYNDGRYHYVAASISATNGMRLYVDGALVASNASITSAQSYSGYWRINNIGNQFLNATIDHFKVYSDELNLSRIQTDMFDTSKTAANLLYYYNFDRGVANANNAGINTLPSVSTTSNTGTLNNFTLNNSTSNWVESYAMTVPTATSATSITSNSFTANWTAPLFGDVDNYVLDVSTNAAFSSFVSGFNGLSVTSTSRVITGLTTNTVYYYRVRASKSSVANQGQYSNTISVIVCTASSSTTNLSICSNQLPYSWNGLTFNSAGSQTATLTNAAGCDSLATLNLTVKATSSSTTNLTICSSALPYTWNGLTFNTAGSQTATLTNAVNCDSLATLNLTVKATSSSSTNLSICSSALPYSWNGLTFNAAGSQTKTGLTNAAGCDSSATLNLSLKNNYTITATAGSNGSISNAGATTVCEGNNQVYSFTPNSGYSISGVVVNGTNVGAISSYTFTNVTSNQTISVSFVALCSPTTSNTNLSICQSQIPFSWNGLTFNTAGTQTAHINNVGGCDSAATLNLTVNQATSSTTNLSVCSSQLPYIWNGLTFNTAGTQTKTGLINSKNCDSTATLVLAVTNNSAVSISVAASANNVCSGTIITFTATPNNSGTAPTYQWKKNGNNVGGNSATYTDAALNDKDSIWCVLTSNSACVTGSTTASSSKVKMTIKPTPANFSIYQSNLLGCTLGSLQNVTTTTWNTIWSSSDTNVATVTYPCSSGTNGGIVKAKANGSTTLTCTIIGSNGCSNIQTAVFKVDAVTPAVLSGASSACVGSSVSLSANTAGGVWSSSTSSVTVSTGGLVSCNAAGNVTINYKVTNSSNCNATTTKALTINAKPSAPTLSYATGTVISSLRSGGNFCNNRSFSLVGTPSGGSWASSNTAIATVNNAGLVNTVGLGTASIIYTVTNAAGCTNSSSGLGTVVACSPRGLSLTKDPMPNTFTIYPNPARSFINVKVDNLIGAGSVVVTDLYGKQLSQQSLTLGTNTVNVSKFAKGMYLVSVVTEGGKETRKVIVE